MYSGPLTDAEPYFKQVGFVPDELRSNIADYMLDSVIRASDDDVDGMIERFARWNPDPLVVWNADMYLSSRIQMHRGSRAHIPAVCL